MQLHGWYVSQMLSISNALSTIFSYACPVLLFSVEDNGDEVLQGLFDLSLNRNSTSLAEDFNTLVGTYLINISFMCTNGCESCYNGVCGLLEIAEENLQGTTKSNFTKAQILAYTYDIDPFATGRYYYRGCFDYTSGSTFDGKLCFGLDLDGVVIFDGPETCFITYDDVACTSCIVDSDTFCYVADCTNIDSSAMINSCNGTGFVGPFAFLEVLDTESDARRNATLGSCDVQTAPIAPIGSTPTAPVNSPMGSTPTAPVKAQTASTPTAPTTSGSAVLGVAVNALAFGIVMVMTYF
jgi:hypothetical protein